MFITIGIKRNTLHASQSERNGLVVGTGMSDIVFIQENGLAELLGVEALSAYLTQHGYSTDLILLSHTKDYLGYIAKTDPRVVAFSVLTANHHIYYRIASVIKKRFPDKILIMGGPHVTYYPESLQYADVDIYCLGDGEYPLRELFKRLEQGNAYDDIPGLWIKQGDTIVKNHPTWIVENLDSLPLPNRALYYAKYTFMADISTKRFITSRGCPFPCTYCFNHVRMDMYGRFVPAVRFKSADTVIREIVEVKREWPLYGVHFSDESFGLYLDFLKAFCEKYKALVGLPFSFLMRFDQIDEEKIELLKDAGCVGIEIGLESGSERVRKDILKKPVTTEKIRRAASLLKHYKIKFYTSNIIGIPTESFEEMIDTLRVNREIGTDYTDCNIFIPFPKLWLTKKSKEIGHLADDYNERKVMMGEMPPRTKSYEDIRVVNLKHLFFLLVKLPIPLSAVKLLITFPYPRVYQFLSMLELYKSMRFFRIRLLTGLKYFFNTYWATRGVIFGISKH